MREIKKIISVFTLVITIFIFGNLANKVEASEYYCGTTDNGTVVYLLTETISGYDDQANGIMYINCKSKFVKNNNSYYVMYSFRWFGGTIQYSNSNGASGEFGGAHRSNPYTIATNMFNYCCKYLGY